MITFATLGPPSPLIASVEGSELCSADCSRFWEREKYYVDEYISSVFGICSLQHRAAVL